MTIENWSSGCDLFFQFICIFHIYYASANTEKKEFKNEPEVLRLSEVNELASNLILGPKTSFKGVSVLGKIG